MKALKSAKAGFIWQAKERGGFIQIEMPS